MCSTWNGAPALKTHLRITREPTMTTRPSLFHVERINKLDPKSITDSEAAELRE